MYFVYVLQSLKDKNFYIGFTNNLYKRLQEHNRGDNISTSKRKPFKLIFYEAHHSKTDALRREKYLKTSKGKATLKQILRDYLN